MCVDRLTIKTFKIVKPLSLHFWALALQGGASSKNDTYNPIMVCGPTPTQKNGILVVYVRDPVKIFKQEPIAALEYSFSSWPLSVNRVKVKSIKCMQKLLGKWTYQTNGSLKKSESWCTLIILASIIFSLFQMKPLLTDKNGLLPFPLLPTILPNTAWLTAESAAHTEVKGQKMNRRRMVPRLFSSLSADTKVSRERLKLVTMLNSLYLAHLLLLLSSSLSCNSLQLGKKRNVSTIRRLKKFHGT